MKKIFICVMFFNLMLASFAPVVSAQENNTPKLSAQDQKIVTEIQSELNKQLPKTRGTLTAKDWEKAIVNVAFDFGFARNNSLFKDVDDSEQPAKKDAQNKEWYDNLKNKSQRELTVYDIPTKKDIKLIATYIDNQSSKTVILHSGYRAAATALLGEAEMFSKLGYNVLLPDTRSHNRSGGEYITFGYYEKDDLNKWIDQETALKPDQEILLYGVSMGAAATMLSQQTPHENVTAYIADCGYASLSEQLKDTLHLLTRFFKYIPYLNQFNWNDEEDKLINLLNELKIKPILGFDLYEVTPLESVKASTVPKLFVHGGVDWFISPRSMDKLYKASPGYTEKLLVRTAAHAKSFRSAPQRYEDKVTSFLYNVEHPEPALPKVADISNRSHLITFGAEKNTTYHVSVTNPAGKLVKEYKGTVPVINAVFIPTLSIAADSKVSVTIQKGIYKTEPVTVTVKDSIAPPAPKLNKFTTIDTNLTGKAEKNAKITIKTKNGQTLATSYADDNGNFSIAIGNQELKTQLLVTATDKAGNESRTAKIDVKKGKAVTVVNSISAGF
ncbi:Ig-like domain-containing protein [Listeria sp. PSOL-1]|uniref:Ig-like domain-containing protein n=1 Tax=Listeria sp. PSOL-1 TaxID=1844999 RepID=UPI0013D5516B|nr:Ig-like domain-containing protein [Listeria sp. PSOL-1]